MDMIDSVRTSVLITGANKGLGAKVVMVPLDVTSDTSVADAVRLVREHTDRLDVLINIRNNRTGRLTVTEGTDSIVGLATLDADGPTGIFIDRLGPVAW
ncbi:hypothetical protein [Streptomyces adelaidensis]|uniref:hypothetical protein n=1 Tax=Streptomyces adelaidensis TaxID=2796465 RepID=UPI001F36DB57|nr:hypothetical protein [Streptomyces adelaidensis]